MIDIIPLTACQNTIPQLASLWHELLGQKWAPHISCEQVVERFQKHCNDDQLPITLVAFKDGNAVGMCSLREQDGIREDLKPWLGSLVVDSKFQGQGIAVELIEAIKQKAKRMNYKELFLFTFDETLPNYYSKLGWETIGRDIFQSKPVTVMRVDIY